MWLNDVAEDFEDPLLRRGEREASHYPESYVNNAMTYEYDDTHRNLDYDNHDSSTGGKDSGSKTGRNWDRKSHVNGEAVSATVESALLRTIEDRARREDARGAGEEASADKVGVAGNTNYR